MAVGSGTPYNLHTGNGVTVTFGYTFTLLDAADLVVRVDGAVTTAYSVSGLGSPSGGAVTFTVAPANGASVELQRVIGLTRLTDYQNNGDLLAPTLNADFDRLWMAVQGVSYKSGSTLRAPFPEQLLDLPGAAARADKVLGFDASGQPVATLPATGSGTELAIDLASSSAGKGASLVAFIRNAAAAVASSVRDWMNRRDMSVLEFMTPTEIAAVQAYNYTVDVTTAVQNAMNAAYSAQRRLMVPAGGYMVAGLTVPGSNSNQGKASRFRLTGDAFGEAGVIALRNRGTVFYSTTNAPVFKYTASLAGNSCGDIEISHISIWGTSSTPLVHIETLFGNSHLHHLTLVQSGTGDGIKIGWGATYEISNSYVCGASYSVASGLGASRTGVGVNLAQDDRSAGLQTLRKVTVAGWHTCIKVGVGGTGAYLYSPMIDTCELAFYYRGIHLTDDCESGTISQCYFEGQDSGIGVLDEGNYNRVRDSLFFFNGSGNTFIDSLKAAKFGSRYTGNVFYLFSGANSTGIDVRSNAVNGGPAKVIEDNHFVLSAGTANVTGIKLQGVDPRVNLAGNDFQPAGAWTGSGTAKIADTSASSDTTPGSARYGFGFAQSLDGSLTVPSIGRGAVNLEVEPSARNNTHISSGVLALGELSVFTLTPTGNVAITSFSAPNLPGKTFSIHVAPTAFAVTFTHGALLKLAGGANLVTGANGCWISFQIKAGGVAWETGRTLY